MDILGWKCVWKCFFLAVEMVSSAIWTQDFWFGGRHNDDFVRHQADASRRLNLAVLIYLLNILHYTECLK
jgi:hypothetical protein